jgi:hypothetical protein
MAVKKSRALLKLFDDTDGGMDGLIELLDLFQAKTSQWMNVGRHGISGFLIRKWLQPDFGMYFLDEDPIYMSMVGFSAAGKTKQEIASLADPDFKNIAEQARDYGVAVGEYLGAIEGVMNHYGISAKSETSSSVALDFKVTHNDFFSGKLYQRVAHDASCETRIAPVMLFILSQVNIGYALLPRLLPSDSNLLVRLQFLTVYHVTRSLSTIQHSIDSGLAHLISDESISSHVPNAKKVRNVLAHYGLGEGKKYISSNSDILNDVIKGFSGMSKSELLEFSSMQLQKISEWTRNRFSKSKLKGLRALLGDHT